MIGEAIEVELPNVVMDWPNNTHLIQGITKLEYVLLDDNYKTLHKPVCCKDYFNEVFATEIDGKERAVYGFRSEKLPIDIMKQERFKLALRDYYKKQPILTEQYIASILSLLNQIETNRGYSLSTIEETQDKLVIVLNSDTKWMEKPAYFSMYTQLIRLAYNYTPGNDINKFIDTDIHKVESSTMIKSGDAMQIKPSIEFVKYMMNGGVILQKWEDYLEEKPYTLHNNAGLNTYFSSVYKGDLNKLKKDVENSQNNSIQTNDIESSSLSQSVEIEEQVVASI